MLRCVSDRIRRIAGLMDRVSWADQSESPYQNINIYQLPTSPSDPGQEVGLGPPSVYNDTDVRPENDQDRLKRKDDVRRQGERPQRDTLDVRLTPTTVTVHEDPKTDVQGKHQDFVPARGMGEAWEELNRETWRSEGPGGQLTQ